ncbi:protein NO VEIN domain-containing protein [Brachybacterium paraconglomeratum]|uniref:protein NO VEIN domain-containing protein n=1 Tax=Brachybacterium paraconglomeratum TaxID=173362 RepID=UPI0022E1F602|nr:DUF3883 domain-containing protein [Brachybacterium paraconglomeratum]
MNQADLLKLSNHEIEARAIEAVIAYERAAGRKATDTHTTKGALVDVESVDDATGERRLIEIKAFGGAGRGDFLWLEPNQVKAFEQDPAAHLYLVTNVRSADPSATRILDLTGEQLRERLRKKREKHYFEVPMPVAVYDDLVAKSSALPPSTVRASPCRSSAVSSPCTIAAITGSASRRRGAQWSERAPARRSGGGVARRSTAGDGFGPHRLHIFE